MEVQPVTPDAVAPAVAVQEGSGAAQEGDGAEVEDGAVAMTEALSLRMGVIHSIRSLNGSRLRSLLTRFCLSLAQIVAFSVILAKASAAQETCEQPLRIYLALHLTRISLSLPLSIYAGLVPPVPSRHDTAAIIAAQEANRRIGSPRLDLRLRKISDLLALASVILFILANVWVFSSTCDRNAPLLYYGALAALIISYLYVAEVVFIILAVLFFLPIVIILMRMFGFGIPEKKNDIGPLGEKDLAKIPKVVYAPLATSTTVDSSEDEVEARKGSVQEVDQSKDAPATTTAYPPVNSTASSSTPPPASSAHHQLQPLSLYRRATRLLYPRKLKKRSNSFLKSLATTSTSSSSEGEYVDLVSGASYVFLPENLSTCSICLCDYEIPPLRNAMLDEEYKPEFLRQLPCKHCFHVECCDSWLAVSGRCPVCQAPIFPPSTKSV